LWSVPIEGWVQTTGIAVGDDGTLYVAGALGAIYAIDPEQGDELWSLQLAQESSDVLDEQFYAAPLVANGKLYIGNENTYFYSIHLVAPTIEIEE
ncbi:MAG: PQQ-binding-like beta-propeller repeat protein, partial [Myxococcota bacterium]|nr:PQQ-binding-like beta-propeller repeat protein [Myxococcota bacterium]